MKIHIIGGGIGGMSCALHLAKLGQSGFLDRQVEVCIYEQSARLGGKSQSQIAGFPGEHGFRFFPNFYRAVVDTLKHVELTPAHVAQRGLKPELAGKRVLDLLQDAPDAAVALSPLRVVRRAQGLAGLPQTVRDFFEIFELSLGEALKFAGLLLRFITSCEGRMLAEYEHETLESFFFQRHRMSDDFRTFVASLRALSAMRANRGSLRTLLFTATQMLVDFDAEYRTLDGVLPGPTDWLMLEPWQQTLQGLGVRFELDVSLKSLEFRGAPGAGSAPALARALLARGDGSELELVPGPDEHVVLAIPFEKARPILLDAASRGPLPSSLRAACMIQQRPDNLGDGAEPMVGFQLFLRRRSKLPRGHVLYVNSAWAMTSIAQGQFWENTFVKPLAEVFNQPELVDIVSGIVSAWDVPGGAGKSPRDSSEDEILAEALRQMNAGLGADFTIDAADILHAQIDRDIRFDAGRAFCPTPLWVSPAGSYTSRPPPDAGCSNFFIASDWARTATDVGSMESADEAARLSVRAIAERSPLPPPPEAVPEVRPLRLWSVVEHARAADRILFESGMPHLMSIAPGLRQNVAAAVTVHREVELVGAVRSARSVAPALAGRGSALATPVSQIAQALDATGYDEREEPSLAALSEAAGALSRA
jgi:uncharacterized protein with NAD-binding domain and iron-sulfur cluster